jgi:hypothetical protein
MGVPDRLLGISGSPGSFGPGWFGNRSGIVQFPLLRTAHDGSRGVPWRVANEHGHAKNQAAPFKLLTDGVFDTAAWHAASTSLQLPLAKGFD